MISPGIKFRLRRVINATIPQKDDSRREIVRKILLMASVLVMLIGTWIILSYYADSYRNSLESKNLRELHRSTASSSPVVSSSSIVSGSGGILPEFTSLYTKNKEIKGWITIANTDIDYPVVQSADNSKYLNFGFDQQASRDGALFLDYRDRINPMSQNLIIYGHNMKDGQMFSQLQKYERRSDNDDVGFYNSSPLITFNTIYGRFKWKIFAVFVTTADSSYSGAIYYLNTDYSDADSFNSFITAVKKRSFINTSVDVKYTDNLLTLSTCDYVYPETKDGNYARLVVMARKIRSGESTAVAAATKNTSVIFPDYYYKVWKSEKSS
jgi:sortase B